MSVHFWFWNPEHRVGLEIVFSISGAVERGERGGRTEGEAADSRARAAAGGRSSRARWRDPLHVGPTWHQRPMGPARSSWATADSQ